MERFLWLSDHIVYTPLQIKQNTRTFHLFLETSSVFEKNQELFASKIIENQERLKRKIELFRRDLNKYRENVKDYENWGNISHLFKYRHQATILDKFLVDAMDKIDRINEEESAFGWEQTQYPLRKETHDLLIPYKKLFDSGQDFIENRDLWLNSQIGSHDPEDIENKVGNIYRAVLKMEKSFSAKPVTQKLAEDVNYANQLMFFTYFNKYVFR